jgi:hypothetical protein
MNSKLFNIPSTAFQSVILLIILFFIVSRQIDHKRDNIDVKRVILNLEKKHLLKRGKFLKGGSRFIQSWIKILPEPTNDEQIQHFQNELNNCYKLELEQYVDYYENGIGQKPSSSLTETSERILLEQQSWIEQLRWKLHNPTVQQNSSGKIFLLTLSLQLFWKIRKMLKKSRLLLYDFLTNGKTDYFEC